MYDLRPNFDLKLAILKKGISQEQLSVLAGIPQSYISQAIRGRINLTATEKQKIAAALDLDPAALFE